MPFKRIEAPLIIDKDLAVTPGISAYANKEAIGELVIKVYKPVS